MIIRFMVYYLVKQVTIISTMGTQYGSFYFVVERTMQYVKSIMLNAKDLRHFQEFGYNSSQT
jgi:hypothetical protein